MPPRRKPRTSRSIISIVIVATEREPLILSNGTLGVDNKGDRFNSEGPWHSTKSFLSDQAPMDPRTKTAPTLRSRTRDDCVRIGRRRYESQFVREPPGTACSCLSAVLSCTSCLKSEGPPLYHGTLIVGNSPLTKSLDA